MLAPMFIAALFTGAQGPLRGAQVAKPCTPRVESFPALRRKERLTRYDVLLSEGWQARAKSSREAPRAGGWRGDGGPGWVRGDCCLMGMEFQAGKREGVLGRTVAAARPRESTCHRGAVHLDMVRRHTVFHQK